jgi:hypothetical protein
MLSPIVAFTGLVTPLEMGTASVGLGAPFSSELNLSKRAWMSSVMGAWPTR